MEKQLVISAASLEQLIYRVVGNCLAANTATASFIIHYGEQQFENEQ